MRSRMLAVMMLVSLTLSAVADVDRDVADRLGRRDVVEPPAPQLENVAAAPSPNNFYLKVAATNSDGSTSPAATLGLQHREDQHPWFAEVTYKYRSGVESNHNNFSGAGQYQFWTGTGKLLPLLQLNASHAIRPGSNQSTSIDVTGEISIGNLSLDAIATYAWFRPKGGETISDLQPGVSAYYSLSATNLVGVDYTFDNDVDGEDSFDVSFRHKLPAGFAIDVVGFKHNDVRVRIRKNFGPLRSRP